MLLDTITLMLRETLEAGTLIAILLSIANVKRLGIKWLWVAFLLGIVLACIYAFNFEYVTKSLDYAGQEVLNASMQILISLLLMSLVIYLLFNIDMITRLIPIILLWVVVLLLTRELTEMIIFFSGFSQTKNGLISVMTSSFIGLTIGLSIGVLSYAVITHFHNKTANYIQITLLTMISAGLLVQALQLLMQVDWISSTEAVWDTNWLIQESSVFGQMFYAVFGYEATPTLTEISAYFAVLIFVFFLFFLSSKSKKVVNR